MSKDLFGKPIYKEKKCKECKQPFTPNKPIQPYCSPVCMWEAGKKALALKTKKENQEWKKTEKEKIKSLSDWKADLQTEVNSIVRLIDKGQLCLARQINAGQLHGGHVFSSGANKNFTYNCHNIHRQSAQSNHWQNDDALMKEGLEREYGRSYLLFVTALYQ